MSESVVSAIDFEAYVRSSAQLLALSLDEAQVARVADHLARTATMAALLEEVYLSEEAEPANLYCPAPFLAKG